MLRLRLHSEDEAPGEEPLGAGFDEVIAARRREADAFYAARTPAAAGPEETRVTRQALAGLLWSEQFYHYVVKHWLEGDPAQPPPPAERGHGRNSDWMHVYNRDVLSVPDKWEYPWYASWDLAFHMIPLASVDPEFAKQQLILFMREWYMHASGQLPACEFSFSDANPPVHAWACWRVYKMTGPRGGRDRHFLARVFHKLMINFTWWVNRKDRTGNNLFSGGFLGLDNIGVFDRSRPLPTGGELEQADATAWMAFFCSTMLTMALELAREDPVYEDVASKFFEHFVAIADAINTLGGTGLWDETDGFYYDQLDLDGARFPLRVRSLVGAVPLFAAEVLELSALDKLPGFRSRLEWFLANRQDLTDCISYDEMRGKKAHGHFLIAIPTRQRLERVLRTLLAEDEFLSPWGIRSLSKFHERHPYVLDHDDGEHRVRYTPGEADSRLFGGNSNWRGPVWLPMNYLIVEALERYHRYYRNELMVECPTGSGRWMTLKKVAKEIATLQELSGGRFTLGVGMGWHKDEFDFMGVPFKGRGRRADEAIRLMRALWSGEPNFEGELWSFHGATSEPHPSPIPEIWVGGSSKRALRRARELGDAWHPSRGSDADHVRRVKDAYPHLRVIPRTTPDKVDAMLEAGAEGAVVSFENEDAMREFAQRFR